MPNTPSNMFTRHIVNTPYPVGPVYLYVFERRGGLVLFDTGPPTKDNFDYIKKNINLDALKYVFITHSHADHSGGLRFIDDNSSAKLFMPKKDIVKNRLFDKIAPNFKKVFIELGFPKDMVVYMYDILLRFKQDTPIPNSVLPVEEALLPEGVSFIPFPGHSLTDFVYIVDNQYALTGDFLLNDIFQTPLIEIDPSTLEPFNNYEAYCKSISNVGKLNGLSILPSHSNVKSVLDTVAFYVDKIIKRSDFMLRCLKENCTVFDAVKRLTDPYKNPFKAYLKASELVFFKYYLENPNLLRDSLHAIGLTNRFKGKLF